jgi:Rhodanase C-terminal
VFVPFYSYTFLFLYLFNVLLIFRFIYRSYLLPTPPSPLLIPLHFPHSHSHSLTPFHLLPLHLPPLTHSSSLYSTIQGVNYVFDERMGARVTEDILSLCESCGTKSDRFTNCNSYGCHVSTTHMQRQTHAHTHAHICAPIVMHI